MVGSSYLVRLRVEVPRILGSYGGLDATCRARQCINTLTASTHLTAMISAEECIANCDPRGEYGLGKIVMKNDTRITKSNEALLLRSTPTPS